MENKLTDFQLSLISPAVENIKEDLKLMIDLGCVIGYEKFFALNERNKFESGLEMLGGNVEHEKELIMIIKRVDSALSVLCSIGLNGDNMNKVFNAKFFNELAEYSKSK